MSPVQRSFFFSAVERYASLLLFLVATAVLSRLLTPAEFGTYAVANAITSVIAASFQEFGGANYLIQKQELTSHSVGSAFAVTLAISIAIFAIIGAIAGPLASFFGQEGLRPAIAASALNFMIAPFSGTASALFRRELDFRTLAICNLASGAVGSAVAVLLALYGFSYMAPIWGGVVGNVALAIMLLARRSDLKSFRPRAGEYREVLGFGMVSSGVSVINVFYNLSPQLFLARILDFSSVGLYSRATSITQVFDKFVVQVLNPVIMPAIAARRSAGDDLKRVYLESLELLSAVQWPALLFVALAARPIILTWLGPNWLEIVPLVRLLCLANLAMFAACLSYPILVAVGRVRDALIASAASLPPSLLIILFASFFGVHAVAAAALVTLPFQAAIAFYFIGRRLGARPGDIFQTLTKSATVAALVACGVGACLAWAEASAASPAVELVAACLVAATSWLSGLVVTSHPLLTHFRHAAEGLAAHAPWLRPTRFPN